MSKVRIDFKCGHSAEYARNEMPAAAQCAECGERRVIRVTGATPKFTGACSGPLVVKT